MIKGKQMHKPKAEGRASSSPLAQICISHLKSLLVSLLLATVMLILSAIVAVSAPDPDKLSTPLALITLYVSSFAGAVVAAENSKAPLVSSVIHGGVLLVFYAILSIFNYSDAELKFGIVPSLILHAGIPLVSIVGGLIVMKHSSSKKSMKRHK